MKLGCPTEPHCLSLAGGDVTLAGYPLERACSRVQWSDELGTDTKEGEAHAGRCVTGIQAQ